MKKQIEEVIKKHLPEATAGEMRKFIEEAEETEKELKRANSALKGMDKKMENQEKEIESQIVLNENLKAQIVELKSQIDKCEDCGNKYAKVNHVLEMADTREMSAFERISDMKELVSLAFKSPSFKKKHFKSRQVPFLDNNGCFQTQMETENGTTIIGDQDED